MAHRLRNIELNAGMHNIRPQGQIWPVEAFYLANQAQNLVKTDISIVALGHGKIIFMARLRFELNIPELE